LGKVSRGPVRKEEEHFIQRANLTKHKPKPSKGDADCLQKQGEGKLREKKKGVLARKRGTRLYFTRRDPIKES